VSAYVGTPVILLVAVALPSLSLVTWFAMNFTGCTTFTSQTGASIELKLALRPLLGASSTGLALAIGYLVWNLLS
jgi:hypothetical protein